MKIFNKENEIEKVYVQMNDIMMLNQTDLTIPATIYLKIFNGIVIVDDSNRMNFVEFTDPKEIEFFKKLDWIIDYKEFRDLSEDEIIAKRQEIANELNEIANEYNNMSDEEKKENQHLPMKHELLKYKFHYFAEILWIKQGHIQMPFPVVPDSDGFSFVSDNEDFIYEIKASLDPNKLLLFRRDGKELSEDEMIPQSFIQGGMSIAIMQRSEKDEFFGDFETINYLTYDNKYLVTEFKVRKHEEETQELEDNEKEEESIKEESGFKKLVKSIFGKNKK